MSFEVGPHRTNLVLCPPPSNHSCMAFSSFDRPCSPSASTCMLNATTSSSLAIRGDSFSTLASAKVFELEGQVEEMNALYNLKLRQENSRPSTPAFAPKDSESMLHQQAHASSRELQASRQSEITRGTVARSRFLSYFFCNTCRATAVFSAATSMVLRILASWLGRTFFFACSRLSATFASTCNAIA